MHTFIFDVDNTLTPPRQKIELENFKFFINFIKKNNVYLVSGSDYDKLLWQLSEDILNNVNGVFGCLGNSYHIKNKLIYKNNFVELVNTELRNDINNFINNSKTPIVASNHVEERIGMLNISTVGREATIEQRKIYHQFDMQTNERKKFADYLSKKYPHLDVSIGGEISIDISVKGYDKSQILNHLDKKNNLVFFGDRCDNGGNDAQIATGVLKNGGIVYSVEDYKKTFKILSKLVKLENEG